MAMLGDDDRVEDEVASREQVVVVAYDGIQGLDLTGPFEVFHGANEVIAAAAPHRPTYGLTIVATSPTVTTESGIELVARVVDRRAAGIEVDTLVVPGGLGALAATTDRELIALVAELGRRASRIVTVCSGAFVAAAAGLLDGRRIATHWARARALQERFPALDVDPEPIFVRDGPVWSSAGVTAGIDLALAIVEHDHDAEIAQTVARWLVMFLRRPGGQTQFSTPVWSERAALEPIRRAQDLVDQDPGGDHRVGALAERVGMSERHFTRRFTEQVGASPARYVADVRLEAARRRLETTDDTVAVVARRCGFGTDESMRRTFAKRLGVSPDQYRRRFRISAPSTSRPAPATSPRPTDTTEHP